MLNEMLRAVQDAVKYNHNVESSNIAILGTVLLGNDLTKGTWPRIK